MVMLLHEIWIETDEDGQALESCCLAGAQGDEARALLPPAAKLLRTFWAGSYLEAMQKYHRLLGREPYTSSHPIDGGPYPAAWLDK